MGKKLNIREIAQLSGVSPSTVSLVLNKKPGVGPKKREAITNILEANNYTLAVSKNAAKTILFLKYRENGMLVEENQGFIASIFDSIEQHCRAYNYTISMQIIDSSLEETLSNIDYSHYFGIIVLGTELQQSSYHLLQRIQCPFVVIDNFMKRYQYNTVGINNEENVQIALNHCQEFGHKEIAYFSSSIWTCNFEERAAAFEKNVEQYSLKYNPKTDLFKLTPTLIGAYESMKRYLQERESPLPSCAFADNDTIAIGAIKALQEYGYKIPEDISIIGIDDIPFSAINSPSLTTIKVPKEIIGSLAVDQLRKLAKNSHYSLSKTLLSGSLIQRESMKRVE